MKVLPSDSTWTLPFPSTLSTLSPLRMMESDMALSLFTNQLDLSVSHVSSCTKIEVSSTGLAHAESVPQAFQIPTSTMALLTC